MPRESQKMALAVLVFCEGFGVNIHMNIELGTLAKTEIIYPKNMRAIVAMDCT